MKKIIIALILSCFISSAFSAEKLFYNLDGESLTYEELISAPKAVLFIWTSWCPSCRSELRRLSQKCGYFNDAKLLFVNSGEKEAKVKKFIEAIEAKDCVKNNVILDHELILAKKFSIYSIPTFIIIKDGEPVYRTYFLNKELLDSAFKDIQP